MDPLQEYLAKPWLKFYLPGVPPAVEFEPKPVFQLFDDAARRWPERERHSSSTAAASRTSSSKAGSTAWPARSPI
jgi:hypothetical protein